MFSRVILLVPDILTSIKELLTPEHSFAAHLLISEWGLSIKILNILYAIIILFITVGILSLSIGQKMLLTSIMLSQYQFWESFYSH
jgi:hypothetical protein